MVQPSARSDRGTVSKVGKLTATNKQTESLPTSGIAKRSTATTSTGTASSLQLQGKAAGTASRIGVVRAGPAKTKTPATPTLAVRTTTTSMKLAQPGPSSTDLNLSPSADGKGSSSPSKRSPSKPPILVRTRFVIRGKVQGVHFRKFTQQKAVQLGIFGVVRNEEDGSVKGEAEGRIEAMNDFKHWLATKGSPKSRIESADFSDETDVESRKYSRFDIDKD
jgi:acylphosphatase